MSLCSTQRYIRSRLNISFQISSLCHFDTNLSHSKRMTLITRFVHDLSRFIFLICLLSTSKILVHAYAGRCYLCSQSTLAECVGSIHTDSILFHTVLQYYTEPCNGQCILFRNHAGSTIRGCSWTYGHMTSKPTGWHELSPGIRAYFCDSYLCNNGTYEQPEGTPMLPLPLPLPIEQGNVLLNPIETINNPQQMFVHGGLTRRISQEMKTCF